jgi:hypothetical protein
LAGAGEPPLYPAYKQLLDAAYPIGYTVDSLLRTPGAGFPDFTARKGTRLVNWIEVKHPGVSVDPLPRADNERFARYRDALPHIVLTNGWCWRLFEAGQESSRIEVPPEWLTGQVSLTTKQEQALLAFLAQLTALAPSHATTYDEAVHLLATAARLIAAAVVDSDSGGMPAKLGDARVSFSELLRTNPSDPSEISLEDFADALAQTCTFGYLLGRVEAQRDVDPVSGYAALNNTEHPFLRSTLYAVIAPDPDAEAALGGILRTACDMVNRAAPKLAGPAGDWKDVPYVYEPFFAEYRPEDRFRYGVFYTPPIVTRFQVREIQRLLRDELGLDGVTDPSVRFLDPACGTGTYLLALAEEVEAEASAAGMPPATVLREVFRDRVVGFEVSPGPASVAQARLTAWLRAAGVSLGKRFPVFTVNTLSPPAAGDVGTTGATGAGPSVWAENATREQAAGDEVKRDKPVLVVFGNPPWGDRPREVFNTGPRPSDNWIAEWSKNTRGAAINLYDLSTAFWRFAVALLLERQVQEPRGVVCYITNRTWLRGKAFSTMRASLRAHRVYAETTDLGGDVRAGARGDDEPVFAIRAGSAVASLVFGGNTTDAVVARRVRGTRREKLDTLETGALPALEPVPPSERSAPFAPIDWGVLSDAPNISEFFAGHYPGIKTHRDDLVVDVSHDRLSEKLADWNSLRGEARIQRFGQQQTRGGRTRGRLAPAVHDLDETLIRLHRYRPLDDRYLYWNRRFINEPGRIMSLYEADPDVEALLTMDSRTTSGPVVIATRHLPAYNSFRGSYETHAFPLSRPMIDGELTPGDATLTPAASVWAEAHDASSRDVACYLLALGNAPLYAETFGEALESEIVRFPPTTDSDLFAHAVSLGRRLLEAWTLEAEPLGQWQQNADAGAALGSGWLHGTELVFASGDRLTGLHPQTFDLSISKHEVMREYLAARTHLPLSVELATSIRQVAGAISVILEARSESNVLLEEAITGPTLNF